MLEVLKKTVLEMKKVKMHNVNSHGTESKFQFYDPNKSHLFDFIMSACVHWNSIRMVFNRKTNYFNM